MQNFNYCTPTRLIFGKDVVEKLPGVMEQFGKRILLSYGSGSIKKIGLYDKVKELLKDYEIYELPDIQPNPRRTSMSSLLSEAEVSWTALRPLLPEQNMRGILGI